MEGLDFDGEKASKLWEHTVHVARSLSLASYKTFSTLIVLSADPVANHWLPGSTATDLTLPV